jgi:hypothetical protein
LASGSALSYTVKTANGQYVNRVLSAPDLLDDGFQQTDHEFKLRWAVTDKSTADFSASRISRSHPHFAQRDYSGTNTSVVLNWNSSGKTALEAGWLREHASYQTSNTNFTQTNRFYLGPVWQASPKTVVRLRHEVSQRDYLDAPTGLAASQRQDTVRNTRLSLDWRPYQYVTLSAALQQDTRNATLPGLDYSSNLATLSAQFSF